MDFGMFSSSFYYACCYYNGLNFSDLPQYGYKNNQWQMYFGRTFDIFTKLWKFQQQHRYKNILILKKKH